MAPTRREGGAAAASAAGVGGAGGKGSSTTLRRVGCAPPGWCRRFVGASIGAAPRVEVITDQPDPGGF